MKYFILISFVLIDFSFSNAQEVVVKAADSYGKAALFSLSGEQSSFIDSISSVNHNYKFNLAKSHSGFYRLILNNKKVVDFIYDSDDIEMESDSNSNQSKIIHSEENKILYEFIKLNKNYKTKTELLNLVLSRYPDNDDYLQITKEKLNQLQEEYLYFINVTAQSNPKSFIGRYVRSSQLPIINSEVPLDQQLFYLKRHSLDKVDFTDDELIYSDVFANKAIEYLSYFRNPQLPKESLEKEFEFAIDSILNKSKTNDIVYKHIVQYLLDGFKKFGFDNVINYIVNNYVIKDEICLDEKLETALERRIQQSKNFKIGSTVPNIIIPDSSSSLIDLAKIKDEKTLIIFYASWCPHCQSLLPQIYELYKNQKEKKIEVVAISIDTLKTDWLNFVEKNNFNWINASDLKGWAGKAVLDYDIYATPTMFLLAKEKKLIKIITNIDELKEHF